MVAPNETPWARRFRRLTYFFGVAGTFYLISTYALDRMKEARIRALRERKDKDLLKSHFTTLLSTLSFTLYALLPTLSPQLDAAYPVELTSQALQGLSNPASSQISNVSAENESEGVLESSVPDIATSEADEAETRRRSSSAGSGAGVSESWASEFRGEGGIGSESVMTETDDGMSSATSQPISLPPTDLSTSSESPPSDMMTSSQFHSSPSPPRHRAASPTGLDVLGNKSKKELWRDLKVQSITRAITTAYLLPLLYVLTTSQLSTLARERYLADIKSTLPPVAALPAPSKQSSWFPSKDSTGFSGLIAESASLLPNPLAILPGFVTRRLPWSGRSRVDPEEEAELARVMEQERKEAEEVEKATAERMYLTYSWWILHEGWRVVASRVEAGVENVIGPMGLKRDLSLSDWEGCIRDIRRYVDHDEETGGQFDFTPHLLPSFPLPNTNSATTCPLPSSPPTPHLQRLLSQTRLHLASPDAAYLIQGGVSTMLRKLIATLSDELYILRIDTRFGMYRGEEHEQEDDGRTRRLAECLPAFSRWGKGVWDGVPDAGVETLLAMGEFEAFAGLIFGDWA